MNDEFDVSAIHEWTERNRLTRESYFTSPGPHLSVGKPCKPSRTGSQGNPPSSIRRTLDKVLDDLAAARCHATRQDRLIHVMTQEIIALKVRLGDVTLDGERVNVHSLQEARLDDGEARNRLLLAELRGGINTEGRDEWTA